ncbi:MAG TPA: PAS domain-containing protein [Anaerovoracaceae bacterium]|nr:PAS domain-containing protein [Anaerovoracaceae bacterium]
MKVESKYKKILQKNKYARKYIENYDSKSNYQNVAEQMKERLENIIEGTNAGTWEWDIKRDNIIVNNKYAEILGYTLEEISPMNIKKWENHEK